MGANKNAVCADCGHKSFYHFNQEFPNDGCFARREDGTDHLCGCLEFLFRPSTCPRCHHLRREHRGRRCLHLIPLGRPGMGEPANLNSTRRCDCGS